MNTQKLQEKARKLTASRTVQQLVEDFEETNKQKMTVDLSYVRGWIMDELELRNPTAFEQWIDKGNDSPRKYFL